MKKFFYVFLVVVFIAGTFTGCGPRRAKDINVDNIKNACDCIDSYLIIGKEFKSLLSNAVIRDEITPKMTQQIKDIYIKIFEVENKCYDELGVNYDDYQECRNYKQYEKMGEELEQLFRDNPMIGDFLDELEYVLEDLFDEYYY